MYPVAFLDPSLLTPPHIGSRALMSRSGGDSSIQQEEPSPSRYSPCVPLPQHDLEEECAKVARLVALQGIVAGRFVEFEKLYAKSPLPKEIEALRCDPELFPENPPVEIFRDQIDSDLRKIELFPPLQRSVLGLTSGVHFVQYGGSTSFVLKLVTRSEVIANDRYARLLGVLKEQRLRLPEWKRICSDRISLGPVPLEYGKNDCKLYAFTRIFGMPLGSFMIYRYSTLSQAEKEEFVLLLGKVLFLDALLGNRDRLHKTDPKTPSNLGNLLVRQGVNDQIRFYLIDNGSDLRCKRMPPFKYRKQQENFFDQAFDQMVASITQYNGGVPVASTFREDAGQLRDHILSMWAQISKDLERKLDSQHARGLEHILAKQLGRVVGHRIRPKEMAPLSEEKREETPCFLVPNHSMFFFPTTPEAGAGFNFQFVECPIKMWVKAVKRTAEANGSPETSRNVARLAKYLERCDLSKWPEEVKELAELIQKMAAGSENYNQLLQPRVLAVLRKFAESPPPEE